jgi:hypothetical protein
MKLLLQSFMLGIGFEVLFWIGLFFGVSRGHGDVPGSWFVYAFTAAHFPAYWLADHHVIFPMNMAVSVLLSVTVWTGLFYSVLLFLKKLFRKHDHVA